MAQTSPRTRRRTTSSASTASAGGAARSRSAPSTRSPPPTRRGARRSPVQCESTAAIAQVRSRRCELRVGRTPELERAAPAAPGAEDPRIAGDTLFVDQRRPVRPRRRTRSRSTTPLLGAVIGLVIALLVVGARELFDTTCPERESDVEDVTGRTGARRRSSRCRDDCARVCSCSERRRSIQRRVRTSRGEHRPGRSTVTGGTVPAGHHQRADRGGQDHHRCRTSPPRSPAEAPRSSWPTSTSASRRCSEFVGHSPQDAAGSRATSFRGRRRPALGACGGSRRTGRGCTSGPKTARRRR